MARRPVLGPRRSWPPPPGHEGDRNGEPAELDWIGCFLLVSIVALVVIVVLVVIAATFPTDRVYFSDRVTLSCV